MAVTVYKGFDVLEVEPSFDAPSTKWERDLDRLDPVYGKVDVKDRSGLPVVSPMAFRWVMQTRAEIQTYRDFIAARRGCAVPVWVPSWRQDFVLATAISLGATALPVLRIAYTKYSFPIAARRFLAVIMADRTMYYRKVLTATDSGATEALNIDSGLPVQVPASATISQLALCRLADDTPELLWQSRDVAEVTLNFTELPLEVPAS